MFNFKLLPSLLILSTIFTFGFGFIVNAQTKTSQATYKKDFGTSEVLNRIKSREPNPTRFKKPSKNNLKSLEHFEYNSMTLIEGEKKHIKYSNLNGTIKVGLPFDDTILNYDNLDDKIIFDNKLFGFDLVSEVVDGGFRQIINIEASTSPTAYDFNLELEEGDTITLNNDGSVNIKNKNLKTKLFIAKPWATDNNNQKLNTKYTIINKNILRQEIDFTNAVFPIVADPLWCGNAIDKVEWINRNGEWSSSNYPTGCGAWNCANQWACWQEAYDKTPSSSQWNKQWNTNQYWSMYNQFMCHADIPRGTKTPWNIEPAKPDKGYWGFAGSSCN